MLTLFFKTTNPSSSVWELEYAPPHTTSEKCPSSFYLNADVCMRAGWMEYKWVLYLLHLHLTSPLPSPFIKRTCAVKNDKRGGGGNPRQHQTLEVHAPPQVGGKKTLKHFSEISSRCFHITGCKRNRWNTDSPLCVSLSLCPHNSFPLSSLFFSFCLCDYTDNILLLSLNIVTFICMYVYIYVNSLYIFKFLALFISHNINTKYFD